MKKIAADRNYRMLKRAAPFDEIIKADVEYQQFLVDTKECLKLSGGIPDDSDLPGGDFFDCHDPIERTFAINYGQRSFVENYTEQLVENYWRFLRGLGIGGTMNSYMEIEFAAKLKETGHSNE